MSLFRRKHESEDARKERAPARPDGVGPPRWQPTHSSVPTFFTLACARCFSIEAASPRTGASIGAHATIVCGVTIGQWAMIGAGAVVTRDVPDHGLVYGNPARLHGFVCACGEKLKLAVAPPSSQTDVQLICPQCKMETSIPREIYSQMKGAA